MFFPFGPHNFSSPSNDIWGGFHGCRVENTPSPLTKTLVAFLSFLFVSGAEEALSSRSLAGDYWPRGGVFDLYRVSIFAKEIPMSMATSSFVTENKRFNVPLGLLVPAYFLMLVSSWLSSFSHFAML